MVLYLYMEKNTLSRRALLNRIRAAVLGANDGIISTAAVVMGAAGVSGSSEAIITAGFAALVAGALSIAVGSYVSNASQTDAELMYIEEEKMHLKKEARREFAELVKAYESRGLTSKTARQTAKELTEHDALSAHLETEFGISEKTIAKPVYAAIASFFAFAVGGLIPFLASVFAPEGAKVLATVIATVVALAATGYASSRATGANTIRATLRIVMGGCLAMAATYVIGIIFSDAI